ncbi:MAG: hypothetical protein N2170_09070 [Bacteroidia bacterium]|nr:hypothetical protein [Bacteroidia bacterium]
MVRTSFWLSVILGIGIFPLQAQQTLINLPSVELTPAGRLFVLHETQLRFWRPDPYWVTSHFLVYGLSSKFELGVTLYDWGFPVQTHSAIAMGYKHTQAILLRGGEVWEPKYTVGQMLILSGTGKGAGLWSYLMGSFRLPEIQARITIGATFTPNALFGGTEEEDFFGTHPIPLIASVELPIIDELDVVVEWFSGDDHEFAYLTPGFVYHKGSWVFVLSYKIANNEEERDANSFVLEAGYYF